MSSSLTSHVLAVLQSLDLEGRLPSHVLPSMLCPSRHKGSVANLLFTDQLQQSTESPRLENQALKKQATAPKRHLKRQRRTRWQPERQGRFKPLTLANV
jgi:hypothetical protein